MKKQRWEAVWVTMLLFGWVSVSQAELNTVAYVSADDSGELGVTGKVEGDLTGVGQVTLLDGIKTNPTANDDAWNGGDNFIYLYDDQRATGDFTATVRVVSQTQAIDGEWGKTGIRASGNLTGNSANAWTQVYAGNGSQVDPPNNGGHDIVPVRMGGRVQNDGNGNFEDPVRDANGADIINNLFLKTGVTIPAWIRLSYRASSNTFVSAFAWDENGQPGEWGYSAPRSNIPTTGEGWYVGLGYSAHNSLFDDQITRPDALHGITFDNYSLQNEYILPEKQVAGGAIGVLEVAGNLSDVKLGPDQTVPGLAEYWFDGNMRGNADAFHDAIADGGSAANPLLNPGGLPFATATTWWRGSQGQPISDLPLPNYPAELAGTKFAGSTDTNDYGVRLRGQLFIPGNGDFVFRDGIDDYTMLAVDQDGNGELDELEFVANSDIIDNGSGAFGDIVIHDDDWANVDGSDQPNNGYATFENIDNGGEWRDIEIWMSEGGGGDAGILYMAKADDEDLWDDSLPDALTQAQRDKFVIRNDQLQTDIPTIASGNSAAALSGDFEFIVQVSSSGNDQIVVDDAGGGLTTSLDVGNATIRVQPVGDLAKNSEFTLLVADSLLGTSSLTLLFDNPADWDLSGIATGKIKFIGGGGGDDCNGDGLVDIADANCSCNDNLDALLAALGTRRGDADGDTTVQFPDFVILANHFGMNGSFTEGDFDCDGIVQFPDFVILANNFGQSGVAAAAVPEPSAIVLLAVAGLALSLRRRR